MEALLSLRNVVKTVEQKFIFGPIDLDIEPGYVVALVGPNGSGKSTLFRMLMGMVHPDEGDLTLFQKRYPDNEVQIKQRIGYVPETSEIHEFLKTVGDVLHFAAHWYPLWDAKRCSALLVKFELESKQKLNSLSKGGKRKLDLLLALAHQPDLLLLDEPSSGLDPFAWKQVQHELAELMEGGRRSIFMATHSMDEVRRMADYVVFLYHGKVLGYYEKDALLDNWKVLWVDCLPEHKEDFPGVIAWEANNKVISESPQETAEALQHKGINIIETQSLEVDEIFQYLLGQSITTKEGK